ncbi:MAG: hypothetical protein QUV35_02755 [Hydrogenophaga sp.]|uniref:hypothetical protein n=1 Tax=Hydrogenophaga sp. TaxID=1904254 RepID=UPI00261C6B1C|nr:hypothetical protein [Hydrogenophaga sp.]MDM7941529.1 hypothetical protein [Hydrogenophaga sp.]
MQSAPSVVYPVGRSAFQAGLLLFLGLATATTLALYLYTSNAPASPARHTVVPVLGALGWLFWVACACRSWSRSPEGALHWEPVRGSEEPGASGWSWAEVPQGGPVALSGVERVLDLQDRILIRFHLPGAGHRWVWVERRCLPARWADFRRALMSSRI